MLHFDVIVVFLFLLYILVLISTELPNLIVLLILYYETPCAFNLHSQYWVTQTCIHQYTVFSLICSHKTDFSDLHSPPLTIMTFTHQYRLSFINNTNINQTDLYASMQTQAGFLLPQKTRHSFCSHPEIYWSQNHIN